MKKYGSSEKILDLILIPYGNGLLAKTSIKRNCSCGFFLYWKSWRKQFKNIEGLGDIAIDLPLGEFPSLGQEKKDLPSIRLKNGNDEERRQIYQYNGFIARVRLNDKSDYDTLFNNMDKKELEDLIFYGQ